jgi:hypothetical protein
MRIARKLLVPSLLAALTLAAATMWPVRTDRSDVFTIATWNL